MPSLNTLNPSFLPPDRNSCDDPPPYPSSGMEPVITRSDPPPYQEKPRDAPTISILLLGDEGCGKSTFLSYVSPTPLPISLFTSFLVPYPILFRLSAHPYPNKNNVSYTEHRRLSKGTHGHKDLSLPVLRDMDQPFIYDIKMYNRPYRFEFSDTASPENWTLLKPDVVVLCYACDDRGSLESVQERWSRDVMKLYSHNREIPIILLGLKRDLRVLDEHTIYPQEALRIAQEMRCDRYAECSAVTGELCREVFEDIARVAALTTTDSGGLSAGTICTVM
ncbi:MAG: hypothetical protein M1827_005273 [Pycnora praestabilis]|nr:MAG: hypothetical protein M1827_005273 [Pycnora praestabilis]